MIPFPHINPIAISIGSINIHWYGIAYAFGIILAFYLLKILNNINNSKIFNQDGLDAFIFYSVLGVIIGGRVGYVIFYHTSWIWQDPLRLVKIWEGGMSFHGGVIGSVVALYCLCKIHKIPFWPAADIVVCIVPIGIFLGRIANFINSELIGRITNVPWAVIFPLSDGLPRHPSQLYECMTEGMLLMILMPSLYMISDIRSKHRLLSGIFLMNYGVIRLTMELYREPEIIINILNWEISMGQLLSIPLVIAGIILIFSHSKSYAS